MKATGSREWEKAKMESRRGAPGRKQDHNDQHDP